MSGGRIAVQPIFTEVYYKDNEYIVAKKEDYQYVFDKEDLEKIKKLHWFKLSTKYIASQLPQDKGKRKQLLLHNFVMNRLTFPGQGATESVDHINRNPLDNRKENLRVVSQTEQNINQKKKVRNIVQLPENCGITPDEIPRHIWYVKANGGHGDRFAIEFKTEKLVWKSSSSKKLTLQEKLSQAKEKLAEFYEKYPYLNPASNDVVEQAEELTKSFNEILALSL
jgi:hypothetical protein